MVASSTDYILPVSTIMGAKEEEYVHNVVDHYGQSVNAIDQNCQILSRAHHLRFY